MSSGLSDLRHSSTQPEISSRSMGWSSYPHSWVTPYSPWEKWIHGHERIALSIASSTIRPPDFGPPRARMASSSVSTGSWTSFSSSMTRPPIPIPLFRLGCSHCGGASALACEGGCGYSERISLAFSMAALRMFHRLTQSGLRRGDSPAGRSRGPNARWRSWTCPVRGLVPRLRREVRAASSPRWSRSRPTVWVASRPGCL